MLGRFTHCHGRHEPWFSGSEGGSHPTGASCAPGAFLPGTGHSYFGSSHRLTVQDQSLGEGTKRKFTKEEGSMLESLQGARIVWKSHLAEEPSLCCLGAACEQGVSPSLLVGAAGQGTAIPGSQLCLCLSPGVRLAAGPSRWESEPPGPCSL